MKALKDLILRHRYGVVFGFAAGGIVAGIQLLISHTPTFAMWLYLAFGGFIGYRIDEAARRPRRSARAPLSDWLPQATLAGICFWGTLRFAGWHVLLDFFGNWWAILLVIVGGLTWAGVYLWRHGRRLQVFKPVESKGIATLLFIGAAIVMWIYLGTPASSMLVDIAQNRGPQWFWAALCLGFSTWWCHRYFFERRDLEKEA